MLRKIKQGNKSKSKGREARRRVVLVYQIAMPGSSLADKPLDQR